MLPLYQARRRVRLRVRVGLRGGAFEGGEGELNHLVDAVHDRRVEVCRAIRGEHLVDGGGMFTL